MEMVMHVVLVVTPNKLDVSSTKGTLMGYGDGGQMGYNIWLP